jgi:hypothetical protein
MKGRIYFHEKKYFSSRKEIFSFMKGIWFLVNSFDVKKWCFSSYIKKNNYLKVWSFRAEYVNLWRVHLITSLPL